MWDQGDPIHAPAIEVTRVASGTRQTEKTEGDSGDGAKKKKKRKTHQVLWGERYTKFKSSFTKTE